MTSERYYFITGLPRCRSAWFANWLTWGDSFCAHDGFYGHASVESFLKALANQAAPARLIGHSDPANVFFWRQLVEHFPEAKWVVVRRDPEEAYAASCKAFGDILDRSVFEHLCHELDALCEQVKPLEVAFDDLGSSITVAQYLDVPWDSRRFMQLRHMQVQIEPKWLKQQIRRLTMKEAA
jgi:hypothetical protein